MKEVTLLGQIVNLYGRHEFPRSVGRRRSPFVQLLEAVHDVDGLERLRFTSPHPIGFRDDLIAALRDLPKLCEHVHLPLQSGSDRILKAMHRTYTAEKYLRLVDQHSRGAHGHRPHDRCDRRLSRAKTEDDYEQTRDSGGADPIRQRLRLSLFAADAKRLRREWLEQVDEEVKEARNQDLLKVVDAAAKRAGERLVGREVEILCEGPSKTNAPRLTGRTRTNKIVVFEGTENDIGQLIDLKITHSTGFSLSAVKAEAASSCHLSPMEELLPPVMTAS